MSSNLVKNHTVFMKVGQNMYFNDENMVVLLFFIFYENVPNMPDSPIFPPKCQFWVNFDPKYFIGIPYQQLQMYCYQSYYSVSIIRERNYVSINFYSPVINNSGVPLSWPDLDENTVILA